MEKVNKYMINDLLNPLGGTADLDEFIVEYNNVNSNDENEIKHIISTTIKKYYSNSPEGYKSSVKRSLAYFLSSNTLSFGKLYDSCLIAFDHPENPRDFFQWTWEVLFPDEDFHVNTKEFIEVNDTNEPHSYYS